jgi:hypothetical protein
MSTLRRLGALVVPIVIVACGSGPADSEDDVPGAAGSGEDNLTSSATPPPRVTHFPSGDVDLTTYTKAGAAEWKSFEEAYKARHTKATEKDAWDNIVKATKDRIGGAEPPGFTNFVALAGYTQETFWFLTNKPKPIDQDYKLINTTLRSVDTNPNDAEAKKSLATLEGYVKSVASAVNSMPAVKGTVHRRVYRGDCDDACVKAWLDPYVVGKYVREPTFLSTSEKESETCFFRGQAHFVIESAGGAHSIKQASAIPTEEEALFAPNAVFKVDKVESGKPIVCDAGEGWEPQLTNKTLQPPKTETVIHLSAIVQ